MYPGPRDEPGRQGRDSPQDVIIAPGILMRLVPGSPAAAYLGSRKAALKLIRGLLEHFGEPLERGGEVGLGRRSGRRRLRARGECVALLREGLDLRLEDLLVSDPFRQPIGHLGKASSRDLEFVRRVIPVAL